MVLPTTMQFAYHHRAHRVHRDNTLGIFSVALVTSVVDGETATVPEHAFRGGFNCL
jgi:hypothetical protein